MRSCAVLAGRDDPVEGRPVGAGVAPCLLEPPRHLRLGAPHEGLLGELGVHAVGDRARAAHRVELDRLLHGSEPLDEPRRGHELDATGAQDVGRGDRHVRGLDPDAPPGQELGEGRHDGARSPLERHAVDLRGRLRVAEVRIERRLSRRVDEDRGVRALEAREVPHVDEPGDEQRLVQTGRQALDTTHPSLRSASSASARR